ncbi:MAG: NAD(P)/FAD-dependent oxidoreductase, partial [Bacteroidetes bacterium]
MTHSVLIVGTGFSGIALAIELKKRGVSDFILLEKADDVGGTWRENTYPGAECDIPSALYSFSFEPYPDWEYKWSHQPQILDYLRLCAKKYGLYPHIRFGQVFTGATWQENRG